MAPASLRIIVMRSLGSDPSDPITWSSVQCLFVAYRFYIVYRQVF